MAWEDKIEAASSTVVNELQPRFEREVQASSRDVWLMHGRAAVLAKALEMLEPARDEVKLSVPSLDMGMEDLTAIIERVLHVKASSVQVLTSRGAKSLGPLIPSQVEIRMARAYFDSLWSEATPI
jgi:sugar-specific transcriptional regulator TrmB